MGENGATITDASDEMRATWASGMDNAAKAWAAGIPGGTDVLSTYMEEMRAAGATPLRDWDKE